MGRPPRESAPRQTEGVAPTSMPRTTPTEYHQPSHDFTLQAVMDMQKTLGEFTAKIDRLITDVAGVNAKVSDLQTSYTWVKGCIATAVILIPVCAVVVWWLIGDRLNEIKSQVIQTRPPISAIPPPRG